MSRKILDCRIHPSRSGCTLTISGEEDEVLLAAMDHAVFVHGEVRSDSLRETLRSALVEEHPADRSEFSEPLVHV